MHIFVYADSSFAKNDDHKAQLGYVILLLDAILMANWFHFNSYKSKRIFHSVLGGDTYAFSDAFHFAFMRRHHLKSVTKQRLSITHTNRLRKFIQNNCKPFYDYEKKTNYRRKSSTRRVPMRGNKRCRMAAIEAKYFGWHGEAYEMRGIRAVSRLRHHQAANPAMGGTERIPPG